MNIELKKLYLRVTVVTAFTVLCPSLTVVCRLFHCLLPCSLSYDGSTVDWDGSLSLKAYFTVPIPLFTLSFNHGSLSFRPLMDAQLSIGPR